MASGYITIDGVDYNEIWYGVMLPAMDLYQEADLPILNALAVPHDVTKFNYFISERMGFMPLARGERPRMRRLAEGYVDPVFEKWGVGVGTDRDTLRMVPSRHIVGAINRAFAEDSEEILKRMLRVCITNPGTSNAGGGFWNGQFATREAVTAPPTFQQNTFTAAHTHYLTTASASLTIPFINSVKTHVRHHGHKGPLVTLINSGMRELLENMVSITAGITRSPISDAVAVDGFQDQFHLLGVDWYVTEMMPAGYGLTVAASTEDPLGRALVQFTPPGSEGLQLFPGTDAMHPMIESYFERWGGWQVFQRGAGVAWQLTASATYTSPTLN